MLPVDKAAGSTDLRRLHGVAAEAERLGVSKGWLYGEVREGRFPHIKLGTRVLIDPEQTDRFLAARTLGVEEALAQALDDGK